MIHKFVTKYGLATHLALLASLPLALTPFLPAASLAVLVLWLTAFAAYWLFVEPVMLAGEHLSMARARVRAAVIRDPIFWFFLLASVFALVRWLNGGIAMTYQPEQGTWVLSEPTLAGLPGSVGEAGFLPFAVTLGTGVLAVGVLQGLGLAARLSFGLTTSFVLGAGGLAAALCACFDVPAFVSRTAADLSTGPFWGLFYAVGLLLAVVCGAQAESRRWQAARLPFCLAVFGNGCGVLFFAPPLFAALSVAVSMAFAVFCLVYLARVASASAVARFFVLGVLGLAAPFVVLMSLAPAPFYAAKMAALDVNAVFSETWLMTADVLSRMAREIWMEQPWFGGGLDSFKLQIPFHATSDDWLVLSPLTSRAHNAYWTVLAERGVLGSLLLALGLLFLFGTWIVRLVRAVLYMRSQEEADRFPFFCVPAVWLLPFVLILAGLDGAVSVTLSFGTLPFAVVAPLVLAAASFPRPPRTRTSSSKQEK